MFVLKDIRQPLNLFQIIEVETERENYNKIISIDKYTKQILSDKYIKTLAVIFFSQ